MSINITVHGSPIKRFTKTKNLFDSEGNKKKLVQERRKLRLEQVRQKSKEIASQVRKKVDDEKQKQLKRIEEIKKEELTNWKRKLKDQLNETVPEVGGAHRAAKKDWSDAIFHQLNRKESLDLIPAITNKNVTKNKKDAKRTSYKYDDKENNSSNIIRNHSLPEIIEEKPEEYFSSFDEMPSKKYSKNTENTGSKNVKKDFRLISDQNSQREPGRTAKFVTKNCENESKKPSFTWSNESVFKSYASFKERQANQASQNLKKTPSLIMSLGSSDSSLDSSLSSLEVQDIHDETNQHFSRIYSKDKKKLGLSNYNTTNFSELAEPTIKTNRTKFTQISDFINKNQSPSTFTESNKMSATVPIKNVLLTANNKISDERNFSNKPISLSAQKSTKIVSEPLATQSSFDTENTNTISAKDLKDSIRKIQQTQSENIGTNTQKLPNVTFYNQNRSNVIKNKDLSIKSSMAQNSIQQQNNVLNYHKLSSRGELANATSYDYNNRFQKSIAAVRLTTVTTEKTSDETNAVQNADVETQLQKSRERELEEMRRKTEERGQKALEREKVRRDYEMLEVKLEALTKDKQLPKSLSNMNENISEVRLKLLENERINKINTSIENVIRRPVVITLPEIDKNKPSTSQFQRSDITTGINLAHIEEDSGTVNSSDSCCSILLNYVENQSKQITKDIQNSDNNQKSRKLKELLNKLENLRTNLLKELEKSEKSTANKNIQTMFDSISHLRQERENIILLNSEKKDLEKKEKELKQREAILEKKLREFYDMKKAEQKNNIELSEKSNHKLNLSEKKKSKKDSINVQHIPSDSTIESSSQNGEIQDESSEYIEKTVVQVKNPFEIVIKVKEPQKTPYKSTRKKCSLIQKDKPLRKKYNFEKISTPVKAVENSEYTSSTAYKSPPETMRTELRKLIDKNQSNKEISSTQKSYQDKVADKCEEAILKEIKPIKEKQKLKKKSNFINQSSEIEPDDIGAQKEKTTKKKVPFSHTDENIISETRKPFNPVLGQYIQRLLGMSRHSINMLGVSSSDIQTPNSSIINVPNNIAPVDLGADQQDRIKRIQNFIDDNYSFVSEIEESLKREEKSAGESEESIRLIEEIWKKSLKHQTKKIKLKDSEPPKPILKKNEPQNEIKRKKEPTEKKQDELSSEEKVLDRYTELTDNCTQRIAELNDMIERVRKEKQKILEITLSSNGGGNSETEYLDFVGKSKSENDSKRLKKLETKKLNSQDSNNQTDKLKIVDHIPLISSIPETPIKETDDSVERVQLEKNKLTGVSRDSGISLSRPLTALDHRESPDIRDKVDETNFEPFLKDIPKPNQINLNKPTIVNMASISITKQVSLSSNFPEYQQPVKKNKPPTSISRYSPQLVEDVPHELSTILEIDTPATSRLNTTLKDSILPSYPDKIVEEEQQQQPHDNNSIPSDVHEVDIDFQKYPSFEDYAKAHNMDMEQFDPEKSAHIRNLYEELFELTQNVDIKFKKFPSINSFQNQENSVQENKTNQDSSFFNISKEIKIKKFLTPKEYLKKIGATDLLDSNSSINNTQSKSSTSKVTPDNDHDSSSDEECTKEWCLKKFPELREYLEKAKISNIKENTCDKTTKNDEKDSTLVKVDSEDSLPDVIAELKRRNIIRHSFKDESFPIGSTSDSKTGSSSNKAVGCSSSSKENKDPKLFIKAKNSNDISGIEVFSSSQSSREVRKELEGMGMKWASLMLKKQQESKALSSSTSSSFTFHKNEKKNLTSRIPKDTTLLEFYPGKKTDEEFKEERDNSIDTTLDGKFGKPLNLREFLTQELQKRTHSSTDSGSLVDDSLASLFLRSLLGSATPKNGNDVVAGGSSDRQQKTSTPVLLGLSSSSRKSTSLDSNGIKLFSGESRISSVRFQSESSSSNDDFKRLISKSNSNQNHSDDLHKK